MKAKLQESRGDLPLSDEEIREALTRWSSEGFFRSKNLVGQFESDNVTPCRCYKLLLKTQYEKRDVARRSEKVGNLVLKDVRQARSPNVQVEAPKGFENQTHEFRLQGSERIEPCSECRGKGSKTCPMCHGRGKQSGPPCGFCGGSGWRTQSRSVHKPGGGFRTEMVRVSCTCGGFRRTTTCVNCHGTGKAICHHCAGSGNVQTYDLLTVLFQCEEVSRLVNTTAVPDELFATLSGDNEINETKTDTVALANVSQEIQQHTKALLAQSQKDANRSILLQCLTIDRVPVFQFEYHVAGAAPKRLWICGKGRRVYAPSARLSRWDE